MRLGYKNVAPCDSCRVSTGEVQYEGPANMSIRQLATGSDCGDKVGRQRVGRILWCRRCDRNIFPNCILGVQVVTKNWDPKRCVGVWTHRGVLVKRDGAECRTQMIRGGRRRAVKRKPPDFS